MTGIDKSFKFRYLLTDKLNEETMGYAYTKCPVYDVSMLKLVRASEEQPCNDYTLSRDLDLSQDSSTNETYEDEGHILFVKDQSHQNNSPVNSDLDQISGIHSSTIPNSSELFLPPMASSPTCAVNTNKPSLHKDVKVEPEVNDIEPIICNSSTVKNLAALDSYSVDGSSFLEKPISGNFDDKSKSNQPEVILIDSDEEESAPTKVDKEAVSTLKENSSDDVDTDNASMKNVSNITIGSNVSTKDMMMIFFHEVPSNDDQKYVKGVCYLCKDSTKLLSKANYHRHFRTMHEPKATCPRCNKEFSRTWIKSHEKKCMV